MRDPVLSNDYHMISRWRLRATPEEIDGLVEDDPAALVRWWPAAFLSARKIAPGDESGRGKKAQVHTKGWMPYTVKFQVEVEEWRRGESVRLEASGDFEGRLICTVEPQDDGYLLLNLDWHVAVLKRSIRSLSWLLKPIFRSNHRWAMSKGKHSLEMELARRRAGDTNASLVAAPPGPIFPSGPHYRLLSKASGYIARYASSRLPGLNAS